MADIFTNNILKCIFFNKNHCVSFQISFNIVRMAATDNRSALAQVMVCGRIIVKPLSKPMLTISTKWFTITRPQWVKHWSAGLVYIQDTKLTTTVPADVSGANHARLSANTAVTTIWTCFYPGFFFASVIAQTRSPHIKWPTRQQ